MTNKALRRILIQCRLMLIPAVLAAFVGTVWVLTEGFNWKPFSTVPQILAWGGYAVSAVLCHIESYMERAL